VRGEIIVQLGIIYYPSEPNFAKALQSFTLDIITLQSIGKMGKHGGSHKCRNPELYYRNVYHN
jgi:hypothetical protein